MLIPGIHRFEHGIGLVNCQHRTFGEKVELCVCHDRRHFDDYIGRGIETCHLEIDPDEVTGISLRIVDHHTAKVERSAAGQYSADATAVSVRCTSQPQVKNAIITGRVIAHHRAHRLVKTQDGTVRPASARTKGDSAVVGDWVQCSQVDENSLRIDQVEPRTAALERIDRRGRSRILASNFDRMVVVSAPAPGIDRLIIDQYLVSAVSTGVTPILLINKSDLLSSDQQAELREEFSCYADCGYEIVMCAAHKRESLAALEQMMSGHSCVFVGQSGVGKSSLIKALVPDLDIAVGDLSRSGLGSHTTVAAYWYEMHNGGAVVDSPGVREFRVDHLAPTDIAAGFREIADASAHCKFNNCSHRHEPDCAVKRDLDAGRIDRLRYQHFISLLNESESAASR